MNKNDLLNRNGRQYDKIRIIKNIDLHAGFCALILYALNGIRNAEEDNQIPLIYFDKTNTSHFYDPQYGENIWEYFFQPLNDLSIDQLEHLLKEGQSTTQDVYIANAEEVMYNHHHSKNRLATFWAKDAPQNKKQWMSQKRELGRNYIEKYVKVKPSVSQKVNDLQAAKFDASFIIGVHIRGTDFAYAKPTPPETYFQEIDKLLTERDIRDFKIYLATDQEQFVELFTSKYPDNMITYDAIRSINDIAPFRFNDVSPYKKGEDVLIDILLLSKCHYLLKGASAVGEMAMWFNKSLECTDFALQSEFINKKYHQLNSTYLKLNVDDKGSLSQKLNYLKEFAFKFFESNYLLRPVYKVYLSIKNKTR